MTGRQGGPLHGGRVALVTGAGQGLGRAIAHRLVGDGHQVVLADLDLDAATRSAEAAPDPGRTQIVRCDVASEADVAAAVEQVVDAHGTVDVLVNNAAVFSTITMRPFADIEVEEWDRVMAVNVRGAFLCARAAAPGMRARGWGRIINIGSGAVALGRPGYLHYVTSKAALVGMTRSLATEMGGDGVTVNTVTPGSIETEVPRATVTDEQVRQIIDAQAVKRRGTPVDIAGVVSFLASDDSAFVTGQTMNTDGGATYL